MSLLAVKQANLTLKDKQTPQKRFTICKIFLLEITITTNDLKCFQFHVQKFFEQTIIEHRYCYLSKLHNSVYHSLLNQKRKRLLVHQGKTDCP